MGRKVSTLAHIYKGREPGWVDFIRTLCGQAIAYVGDDYPKPGELVSVFGFPTRLCRRCEKAKERRV